MTFGRVRLRRSCCKIDLRGRQWQTNVNIHLSLLSFICLFFSMQCLFLLTRPQWRPTSLQLAYLLSLAAKNKHTNIDAAVNTDTIKTFDFQKSLQYMMVFERNWQYKVLYHVYRTGSCSSFSFSLWVTDRLVVVGFIKGEQRRVDQSDHQNRVHFTKELTNL